MKLFKPILLAWSLLFAAQLDAQTPTILGSIETRELEVDPGIFTVLKLQDYLSKYEYPASQIQSCEAGDVLVFDHLSDFHTQLRRLNRHYLNNEEDDLVLSAFELSKPLSSLRIEIERLDQADVSHQLDNITSDDVFASMLNKNGFVVINGQLYLWDDGCLALQMPYAGCGSLDAMRAVQEEVAALQDVPVAERNIAAFKILADHGASIKNICQNGAFEIDQILESDKVEDVVTRGSSGCGLSAYVSHEVISHDPQTNRMIVRIETSGFGFPNSTILQSLHIDNVTEEGQVTILDGDLILTNPIFDTADWFNEIMTNWGGVYPGNWMTVEIDGNLLNSIDVRLVRNADLLSGNSCVATDSLTIDVICPVSLSHEQLSGQGGAFEFRLTGFSLPPNVQVEWRFGDGVSELTTGQQGIVHAFPQCGMEKYTVTATVQDKEGQLDLCRNPVLANVEAGNPNLLSRYRESGVRAKFDGKRYKLVSKIKPKFLSRKTKIKNKFRYRKSGTKTVTAIGEVAVQVGNDCPRVELQDDAALSQYLTGASSDNPAELSRKRKLKQKIKTRNRTYLDCAVPYRVEYAHSNGLSRTVQLTPECPN